MPLVTTPFRVNTKLTEGQSQPESAVLTDGRIVVVWQDANLDNTIGPDIRGRILNADGTPAGDDFIVNSELPEGSHGTFANGIQHSFYHRQLEPAVAALTDGGFAVVYNDFRESRATNPPNFTTYGVQVVQRFNADGSKNGVDGAINPAIEIGGVFPVSALYADIIGTPNGGFVASYGTNFFPTAQPNTADDQGIVLQAFNAAGASGGFVQANTTTPNRQERPELAQLTDGTVVNVWASRDANNQFQVRGQRFSETGVAIGEEYLFIREGTNILSHDVAALAGGGFVVTWAETEANFRTQTIKFQRVDASGVQVGGVQSATADTNVQRTGVSVAAGKDGGFLIAWNTYNSNFPDGEIRAQIFKADGSANGAQVVLNTGGSGKYADAVGMANGSYFVSWEDDRGNASGTGFDIFGTTIFPDNIVDGSTGPDALAGGPGPDILNGLDGNDVLFGLGGDDQLNGGPGDDVHYGGPGIDIMIGGTGDDQYVLNDAQDAAFENFAEGNDTAFIDVTAYILRAYIEIARLIGVAVTVTGSDTPEQIVGNPLIESRINGGGGDDVLWGGALAHTLQGGAGDDIMRPQEGASRMEGGIGNDAYVVGNIGCVIVENPDEGYDTAFVTVDDYVMSSNVEVTYLSGSATRITGGATGENLVANVGAASRLSGEGGDDTLWGSALADTMFGGAGNDIMRGQGGADLMTGGTGNDSYVVFNSGAVITELANEGYDIVYAGGAGQFFIGENVEEARLIDAGNHLVGNGLGNLLVGNSSGLASTIDAAGGNDIVFGTALADTITGGAGDDIIYALGGADRLVYSAPGWGLDQVAGFSPAAGAKLQFQAGSGVTSFAQLGINSAGGNTQVNHANGVVLLFGVASVSASDFIFG